MARRNRVTYGSGSRPPYHVARRDSSAPETCDACGKVHEIMAPTWVMLASGSFVCSNDECWRVMALKFKENNHGILD